MSESDTPADMTLHGTAKGFAKGLTIVTGTLAGAYLGNSVGQLTGSSPALIEGMVGAGVFAVLTYLAFARGDQTDSVRLDIPDTEVPDEIANNDYMTVVSNPPNGPGVGVWDREDGAAVFTFTSEGFLEEVWLTNEQEVQDVVDQLENAAGGER